MTEQFNTSTSTGSAQAKGVFDDFKAMPLDQKISSLFRMEIETLNEMLTAGANCAMDVFQKVGDAIGNFGTKLEREAKAAAEANKTDKSADAGSADVPPTSSVEPPPAYPTDSGYTPPERPEGSFE